jgi:catechol 2,3-dioxygenase-like lactoylglutathione lyase family enzyme
MALHFPTRPHVSPPESSRPALFAVEIRTTRWEELVAWYRTTLGLRVLMRVVDDRYALLEAGAARLAIMGRDAGGVGSGRWSLAFEVADLDAAHARLAAADPTIAPPATHAEGFRELRATDPDGNQVRLFAWPPDRDR